MSEKIQDYFEKASRVRAIVESKENFVWPAYMEDLKILFDIPNLGSSLVSDMHSAFEKQGIKCHPHGLATQQQVPILLYLSDCRHSDSFKDRKIGPISAVPGPTDFGEYQPQHESQIFHYE